MIGFSKMFLIIHQMKAGTIEDELRHERDVRKAINRYYKDIEPKKVVCCLYTQEKHSSPEVTFLMPNGLTRGQIEARIAAKGFDVAGKKIVYNHKEV